MIGLRLLASNSHVTEVSSSLAWGICDNEACPCFESGVSSHVGCVCVDVMRANYEVDAPKHVE